ncbi:MAG: hypothetical protein J7L53_07020 [Deltaproteobacteria bacterium]|nr:hypothetical protein [Deltaproteobacteria bacterium]
MDIDIQKGMALIRGIPFYPTVQSKAKYALLDISLSALAAAFEEVAKRVPEFQAEIANWNDGRRFAVGVLPKGPYITLEKRGDMTHYLGKGLLSPDVTFLFKNLDSGVLVFTGLMSSHQAVAECRVLVKGNISYAMELNRALAIVQTYLFPGIILKRIFKEPPKLSLGQLITKGKVYVALLPALIRQMV